MRCQLVAANQVIGIDFPFPISSVEIFSEHAQNLAIFCLWLLLFQPLSRTLVHIIIIGGIFSIALRLSLCCALSLCRCLVSLVIYFLSQLLCSPAACLNILFIFIYLKTFFCAHCVCCFQFSVFSVCVCFAFVTFRCVMLSSNTLSLSPLQCLSLTRFLSV